MKNYLYLIALFTTIALGINSGHAESESRSTTGIPHSYTDEFIVTYSLRTMINLY